jgi:hypothetical protein
MGKRAPKRDAQYRGQGVEEAGVAGHHCVFPRESSIDPSDAVSGPTDLVGRTEEITSGRRRSRSRIIS